jgi:hypothetical protein
MKKLLAPNFCGMACKTAFRLKAEFAPWKEAPIFAEYLVRMEINGQNFLNCTTNFSKQVLKKHIMQQWIFRQQQGAFGNSGD